MGQTQRRIGPKKAAATAFLFSAILAFILQIPRVVAAPNFVSPINDAVQLVAEFFTIPVLQNAMVQQGFVRFSFFLLVFALLNWSGRKFVFGRGGDSPIDKRTANIVAFVIAAISAGLMPVHMVLAAGNLWMAFIAFILTLTIPIILVVIAFKVFRGSGWMNIIGAAIVLIAWGLYNLISENIALILTENFSSAHTVAASMTKWAHLIFLILVIWKLFQGTGGQEGGTGGRLGGWLGNLFRRDDREPPEGVNPRPPRERRPSRPTGLTGVLMPPNHPGGTVQVTEIHLWWNENPNDENVTSYEIMTHFGAHRVGRAHDAHNPYVITLPTPMTFAPNRGVGVQIRAHNARGRSRWQRTTVYQNTDAPEIFEAEREQLRLAIEQLNQTTTMLATLIPLFQTYHDRGLPTPVMIIHHYHLLRDRPFGVIDSIGRCDVLVDNIRTDPRFPGVSPNEHEDITNLIDHFENLRTEATNRIALLDWLII